MDFDCPPLEPRQLVLDTALYVLNLCSPWDFDLEAAGICMHRLCCVIMPPRPKESDITELLGTRGGFDSCGCDPIEMLNSHCEGGGHRALSCVHSNVARWWLVADGWCLGAKKP